MTTARLQITMILALAAAAHVAMFALAVGPKPAPSHDGAVSFLAATAHQGDYARILDQRTAPLETWATADTWQRLWQIDRRGAFIAIGDDLAHYDLHPPLYFWLLHLVFVFTGAKLWAALALNAAISLVTLPVVFAFARRVLRSDTWGALAALLWAISAGALASSVQVRQYPLYALCTLVMCWSMMRLLAGRRIGRRTAMLLFASVLAGLLTHYHFIAVLLIGLIYLPIAAGPLKRGRAGVGALICLAAAIIAFALHPQFYLSFTNQYEIAETFSYPAFLMRLRYAVAGTGQFFFCGKVGKMEVAAAVVAVVAVGRLLIFPTRRFAAMLHDARFWTMVYFLAAFWAFTVGAHLTFHSPAHAIGHRYFALIWPLVACATVAVIRAWPHRSVLMAIVFLAMSYNAVITVRGFRAGFDRTVAANTVIADARHIVLDDVRRGVLPPVLWLASPQAQVFAAPLDRLVSSPLAAAAPIGETLYVHILPDHHGAPTLEQVHQSLWPGAQFDLVGRLPNNGQLLRVRAATE